MSIDVFGHPLTRPAATRGPRGPSGTGFNLTTDGNYNIEGKRLCNVENAEELNDVVNLKLARLMIQNELKSVFQVTSSMRSDIDNNQISLTILEDSINTKLKNLETQISQDLAYRNAEIIGELDTRLTALENERQKANSGNGIS